MMAKIAVETTRWRGKILMKPFSTKLADWWRKKKELKSIRSSRNMVPGGLIAVYKPKGLTSQDVCAKIKEILQPYSGGRKPLKVGHGGTLDPMAEGVLVVGIAEGCKGMSDYLAGTKTYCARALLGSETDTLDAEGKVVQTINSDHITTDMLTEMMRKFRGDIMQIPPMYSSLKQNGKRLHALAREGIIVDREPRKVHVFELELTEPFNRLPEFGVTVTSGGGFYVRSLISDLAKSCGGAAHMTALLRSKHGQFTLDDVLMEKDWNFENIQRAIQIHSRKAGFSVVPPIVEKGRSA